MKWFDIRESVNGRSLFRFRGDKEKCQEYIDFAFGGQLPAGWHIENLITYEVPVEIPLTFSVSEKDGVYNILHNPSGTVRPMVAPSWTTEHDVRTCVSTLSEALNSQVEQVLERYFPELIAKEVEERYKAELPKEDDDNCPF